MQLFFPLISKEYASGNKKVVQELSKQVGKWIFIINLPVAILIIIFPGAFLNILFGQEFLGATNALRFLVIGFFFLSLFSISNQLLEMSGRSKTIFINYFIVSTLNVVLNIILIPKYGLTGAAFATMTSTLLLSLIFGVQSYKYLSILPLRRKMLNGIIAVLISSLALIYLKSLIVINSISLIILTVSFFVLYILLIFVLKGFDKHDISVIKSFKNKISLTYQRGLNFRINGE